MTTWVHAPRGRLAVGLACHAASAVHSTITGVWHAHLGYSLASSMYMVLQLQWSTVD
jgi:hypothetical protein